MKKLIIVIGLVLLMCMLVPVSCAKAPPVPAPARGPVWDAVERTLGSYKDTNPVKEDLIKRGLVKLEESGGYIRVQEIEELVREKVYVIDEQGYLQFGPAYTPLKVTKGGMRE